MTCPTRTGATGKEALGITIELMKGVQEENKTLKEQLKQEREVIDLLERELDVCINEFVTLKQDTSLKRAISTLERARQDIQKEQK